MPRITRVKNVSFCDPMGDTAYISLNCKHALHLRAQLDEDVVGLGEKGMYVTTSHVVWIDLEKCVARTKSGNFYYWE